MRIGQYELEEGRIIAEYLPSGRQIKIVMRYWRSQDEKVKRYYIERAGEPIGWIASDLSEGKGKTSTNQLYIDRMIAALKNT